MPTLHARTEILLGKEAAGSLRNKHVLVAGVGGVGGYAAENLARAGIGHITLLDKDTVSPSNINRQIVALHSTIGQKKTDIMKSRIADIDSSIVVDVIDDFMSVETAESVVLSGDYDFIADCIDTIACKAQMVIEAQKHNIPIMSAMGAGNCMDISRVRIERLDRTSGCGLAREMRKRLRNARANLKYPVVFTNEQRRSPFVENVTHTNYNEKATNGTISYMPAVFGVMVAGEIIKNLISHESTK